MTTNQIPARTPETPGSASFFRVPLRKRGGDVVAYATVDVSDKAVVEPFPWFVNSQGYAVRNVTVESGKQRTLPMHRAILGLEFGDRLEADHISRDKLDNRRSNLRVVTHAQNSQNKPGHGKYSQHRGVSFQKGAKKRPWIAYCSLDGRQHYLGAFGSEDEAAGVARAFRAEHLPFAVD